MELTARQAELFTYIKHTIATTGRAPTHREMAAFLRCASLFAVCHFLGQLKRKGRIHVHFGVRRGIEVLP